MEANIMARTRTRTDAPEDNAPEGTDVPEVLNTDATPEATEGTEGTEGTTPEGTEAATPASTDLDLDFLASGGVMLAEALTAETMPVRARNERQMVMDKKVADLHAAWTERGKVGDWNSLVKAGVVATYFVEPEKSAKFKSLVNKAALFHNVRVRYGSSFVVTDAHVARFNLKPEYLGREAISFAVLDKKPRTTANSTEAATTDTEADTEADNS